MPQNRCLVTLGECMVELSPDGPDRFAMGFAGDTYNAAWYARRSLPADWTVRFASCIGDDPLSARLRDAVAGAGIATDALRVVPGQTVGLYMIALENGERSFAYWRGQSAARRLADDPAWLDNVMADADAVLISGITLAILDTAGRARLLAALDRVRARGGRVALDTNMRPRLWPDTATMCAALTDAAGHADVVLPSFDEEQAGFGDSSPTETGARYLTAGAGLVVVKNGAGPVTIVTPDAAPTTVAAAQAEAIVDTTAAGDSFGAGFLAAWLTGAAPEVAVAQGSALAAKVVGGKGALVPV